jgi:hypothetical protein
VKAKRTREVVHAPVVQARGNIYLNAQLVRREDRKLSAALQVPVAGGRWYIERAWRVL